MPVLCNNATKMVGLTAVLLCKLADLVMFTHSCFTALNPLGYQAQLPANFEMNVVVLLVDVLTSSSSEETVWTGRTGPWVDRSTFLKLALVLLSVLIWQLASLLVCLFPSFKIYQHTRHNVQMFAKRFAGIFLRLHQLQKKDGKNSNYRYRERGLSGFYRHKPWKQLVPILHKLQVDRDKVERL